MVLAIVLAVAVEPSVRSRLHARRPGFHVVLGIEMAARRIRRADGVDDGEALRIPEWLECCQARVQAEMSVEVHDVTGRHGDARPLTVVERIAVRYDHVEAVHGAALKKTNQNRTARRVEGESVSGGVGGGSQEQWVGPQP